MKKLISLTIAAITALSVSGCGKGYIINSERAERTADNGLNWTVMVYMCGGDQETKYGAASKALEEMCLTDYPENINVIVQTGGSQKWEINGIYSDYLQRFEMQKGGMYMVDQKMASSMGRHETLTDFLNWGVRNYPADRYAILFWDCGAGNGGVSHDNVYGNDGLNLDELAFGIGQTGRNYDLIGFDASLMSTIETASLLAPYADYMLASPEFMSVAWDYEAVFNYLAQNPDVSAADWGKVICDTYYARCVENKTADNAVMSLIDLSRASALSQAFDGMAGIMLASVNRLSYYAGISRAVQNVYRYGGQTSEEGYSNVADIGDMAQCLIDHVGQTGDIVKQIIDETVIYKASALGDNVSGLGVFYPFYTDADDGYRWCANADIIAEYIRNASSKNYVNYIREICTNVNMPYEENIENYASSQAWIDYSAQKETFTQWARVNEQNMLEFNISGNMDTVRTVAFNLYYNDDSKEQRLMLSRDYNTEVNWDGGIFVDDFRFERGEINGSPVMMIPISATMYSIPVLLNGEKTNLRVKLTGEKSGERNYEICGAWQGVDRDSGMAGRYFQRLKFGDKITPLLKSHENGDLYDGRTIGVSPFGASVKMKKIPDGKYTFEYDLRDIYGISTKTTVSSVIVTDGNLDWSEAVGI